jgi:acyl-CoA reductase-like NAD-dependent aldehyde dehydrogenase
VAHKVAPALAAGDPIIIRPAPQTPVSALKLGELVLEAGWPAAGFAVVPSTPAEAAPLVEDGRLRLLTFTGSPGVGWSLKARAGRKRVTLELGGNAGVIVHHDADVAYAAERVAWGGFSYAGQSCISVQRVYLHAAIDRAFREQFLPRVQALKVGDPLDEATDIGPLINLATAEPLETWVQEACAAGAEVLTGGERSGSLWQPTVLANVQPEMAVVCREVFAPLVGLFTYTDMHAAIRAVDDSKYGLQAGLFTINWNLIQDAFDGLEVGGLMINDVSAFRVDHMHYGGAKQSGEGREGVRYAIEEMTTPKLFTFNRRT